MVTAVLIYLSLALVAYLLMFGIRRDHASPLTWKMAVLSIGVRIVVPLLWPLLVLALALSAVTTYEGHPRKTELPDRQHNQDGNDRRLRSLLHCLGVAAHADDA